MRTVSPKSGRIVWTLAIALVSAALGMEVDWHAPGLGRYTRDLMMRARGTLPAPSDIAIVAIDERSIGRFGRFPWSRQVIARAIDAVAAARPRAIAVDVLFTDPTGTEDDAALARSVGRAGNVVVAAQLAGSPAPGGASRWLAPLPALARAAAGVGHVNVETEMEGVARQIRVRAADDSGTAWRAMAIETIRVADGTPETGVVGTRRELLVGARRIPLDAAPADVVIAQSQPEAHTATVLRGGRMSIDYIGPAGSFDSCTYSLADVVDGGVPPSAFRGKYVLVGATAASMGDRIASPFANLSNGRPEEQGSLMPGVEVLANAVNTILRSRFYSEVSDWQAFLWSALIAAATLLLLEVAQGGHEFLKQVSALAAMGFAVLAAGYLAFTWFQVFPPVVPALAGFAGAGFLGPLRRSLVASVRLDENIADLARSGELLAPGLAAPGFTERTWLPQGLEAKARTLTDLNQQLLARARFVDFALRSVEDGLIIASPEGRITFANRAAGRILGSSAGALAGRGLFECLPGASGGETLDRLLEEGARIEREVTLREGRPRQYILRITPVSGGKGGGPVIGIVATLSDITRQHELQQTKNDLITLVSHEMRTPLTAIQGMTELLADYDVPAGRRREMSLAINDEVKRLARMITEYLDITRLESGAIVLRPVAMRLENLLDRTLRLLDPVAARHGIRLERYFAADLPELLADPDLLSRAVENLVSNAIKYSPEGGRVIVSAAADDEWLAVGVADNGHGIAPGDLERIFDKFYRVPRVEDAGVPGTGLGLSLVREIAELHGGSVAVQSELHAGSVFTLRVPRRCAAK
jgi:PAS domain S-box-containing protein